MPTHQRVRAALIEAGVITDTDTVDTAVERIRALGQQPTDVVTAFRLTLAERRAIRAVAYREAADAAHAEGDRLYGDMGRKAAEGAWSVRDLLRRRADAIENGEQQ